jgi:hypothetical protein
MGVISKMVKGSSPRGARDAVHQQVGRGADQGQRAAHDRGIAQRDQVFRRHLPGDARDLHEDRDHDDDDGRVVHEGRGDGHEAQQHDRHGAGLDCAASSA